MACWLVSCMLFAIPAQVAMAAENPVPTALPSGLHPGSIGVDVPEVVGNDMSINQTASEAIMNWDNFDIGSDASVTFDQLVTDAVLNRVWDENVTGIMGRLSGDGSVFIINPAGIVFGAGATINVGQLVASSLDILDADFLNRSYTFFEDPILGAGQVINYSTDTINAGRIALIGKQVINRGSLVSNAEDGYVIMAAGETVTITENSPVSVVVTLPDGVIPGEYEYYVDNGGGPFSIVDDGDGTIVADHVILAAGDIWSAAIEGVETLRAEAKGNVVFEGDILAQAGAGSDAVADVTIITGGDFTVEDYTIEAVAVGDGVGGFDATAGVTIDAAGEVEVLGDGKVMAEASDGVDNEANVNITGKNVIVETEGFIDPAVVKAYAHDGDNNTAGVTITATGIVEGDVVTGGDVIVEAAGAIDQALVEAKAEDGTKNTATVNITANDNVEVVSDGWNSFATIKAEAVDGSENEATITIAATTGDVQLTHEGGGFLDFDRALIEAKAENLDLELPDDEDALTLEGLVNTATVNINANGDVIVKADNNPATISAVAQNDIEILYDEFDAENSFTVESLVNTAAVNLTGANVEIAGVSGEATVEAIARNEIDVDITHYEDDVTVDLTVTDLENNATVTLDATKGDEGDVLVQGGETEMVGDPPEEGKTTLGDALVAAEAYNVVDIDQHTGEKVKDGRWSWHWENVYAATLNLTTNDLVNNALVDIDATDNIKVIADGSRRRSGSDAIVRAEAYNELVGSGCDVKDVTVNLAAGLILTDDNLVSLSNNAKVQMTATNNNVEVTALHGGFASVKAEAYNKVEGVKGQVAAAFGGGGDDDDIVVFVEADNVANDALVDIDAGDDVLVTAECDEKDSEVEVIADAWNDIPGEPTNDAANITNNANINIDATNVDVKSTNGGTARVKANAYDGTDNTAGVTINADGNVEVMHNDDADASIEAIATSPWGNNNTAAVVIDAYANLLIDNGYVGAWAEGGLAEATVTVDAANVNVNNEGEIGAEADTYFDDEGGALATVGITTTGIDGVVVENSSSIFSDALAMDSGNAEATTTVTASNVTVGDDSEITADAQAQYGSGDATATTEVTTTNSEVIVDENSYIYSDAYTYDSGDATAKTIVKADDVTVDDGSDIYAEAEAYYGSGDATATVDITTTSSEVIVDHGSRIWSYAYTEDSADDSGDTTAETTVIADDVTVDHGSEIWSYADTHYGSGDATATTDITTTSSEVIVDNGSKIYSYAYTYNSGDATADTDILAGSVNILSSEVKAEATNYTYLEVHSDDLGKDYEPDGEPDVIDLTVSGELATATVDITANDGSVQIIGGNGVEAKAKNGVKINIEGESFDPAGDDLTVNLTVEDLTAKADVTIKANEDVDITDAKVNAQAENEFVAEGSGGGLPIGIALNLTVNNLASNAGATITATNGDVEIEGSGDAEVKATAITKLNDGTEYIDVTETVDNVANNATVNITADGDVTVDDGDVEAESGTEDGEGDATATVTVNAANLTVDHESTIEAEAKAHAGKADADVGITLLESDLLLKNGSEIDAEAYTEHGEGNATADVTILAANVTLSESEIEAEAEAEKGAGDATATVDITLTGSDVFLEQSEISADAEAKKGSGDAKATVNIIDADNVTVSDDSEIEADAEAKYGSGDAIALVDIDADDDVLVEDDSEIVAWAYTKKYDSGNATATVDIDAGGNVTVSGREAPIDQAGGGDSSKIMAHAITRDPKNPDSSGIATADVDILAGGNVTATRNGKIVAVAVVKDGDGGQTTALVLPDPLTELVITTLPRNATATVDIVAGGDVTVEKGSEVKAVAKIENVGTSNHIDSLENGDNGDEIVEIVLAVPGDATADIVIDAGGDVTVSMGGEVYAEAGIYNYAQYPIPYITMGSLDNGEEGPPPLGDATATVDILAGGEVTVDMGSEVGAYAWIDNYVSFYEGPPIPEYPLPDLGDATANVYIDAFGDVTVSMGGEVYADAELYNSGGGNNSAVGSLENGGLELPGLGDATANVEITTPGSLTVDKGGEVYAEASIEYDVGEFQGPSIGGLLNGEVDEDSGDATASVNIKAREGVTVGERSGIAADAWIDSYAFGGVLDLGPIPGSAPTGDASASVDILTCGDVIVDGLVGAYADIGTHLILPGDIGSSPTNGPVYSGDTSADVLIRAYGDVIVNSEKEEEELIVESQGQGPSFGGQIEAVAYGGEDNSAGITILAVGDVIVNDGSGRRGEIDSSGPFLDSPEEIRVEAYGGYTNDAFIGIATRGGGPNPESPGDVIVSGQIGAHTSEAYVEGSTNTSDVEISAARDVIVTGGYAKYGSVRSVDGRERDPVQLEGEEGGQIMAEAADGFFNTANVEIFAGRDVTVHGAEVEYVGSILPDSVLLDSGHDGFYYDGGQILALAEMGFENNAGIGISAQDDVTIHGATITGEPFDIDFPDTEPFEVDLPGGGVFAEAAMSMMINSAEVAICALDDVTIDGEVGAFARMGEENSANVVIAAGTEIAGTGYIEAYAEDIVLPAVASIVFKTTTVSFTGEASPEPVQEAFEGCPDCDFDWIDWLWCEDCEAGPFGPAAALVQLPLDIPLLLQGCPVETEAAANELGITAGAMQVSIGNALALNPTLQPCNACATLIDAASILRDEDGSRMAAMTQMFNNMAPGNLPYSPEMQALIATAFAGAAEGSQYASVTEYIDAFVQYYAVLQTDLGAPVDNPLAFVMDKYGAGVKGSDNSNIAAFLAASLESGQTYGN